MKITKEFKELENSAVELTITVAKKDVEATYNSTISNYVKNAQIPGFRKGHVPANVLERKYGDSIKAETMGELIDKSFEEAVKDEKEMRPLPYSQPAIEKTPELNLSKEFSFTIKYDVFPKVEVKNTTGITVKVPQVEVKDSDIEEELKALQEQNAMVMDKEDPVVAKDDIATISYVEMADGKEVEGTSRDSFVFTVGSGENPYKIDDEIVGMKKDETKEITKKYAKDFENADLAGTTKVIKVTVKEVKVRDLPELNDEFAQDCDEKYKTLADMKADITTRMNTAVTRRINELKTNALLEQLVEKNPITLPVSMVNIQLEDNFNNLARQFGIDAAQLEKSLVGTGSSKEQFMEGQKESVEMQLKSGLIVEQLKQDKNISVTPEEIEKKYSDIATEQGIDVEEVKKHYSDPRAKEYLIESTKDDKLFDELFKDVKVSKGDKKTPKELFDR